MLSDEVKELEIEKDNLFKVISLIQKGNYLVDDIVFAKNIEHFRIINRNKTLSYCPFPECCNYFIMCTERKCNADVCDNGYPHRGS
jgi:hypothetical protein